MERITKISTAAQPVKAPPFIASLGRIAFSAIDNNPNCVASLNYQTGIWLTNLKFLNYSTQSMRDFIYFADTVNTVKFSLSLIERP